MSKQTRKLAILLIAIELYFLLPLLVCGLSWYQAVRAMRRGEVAKATLYTNLAHPFFQLSNASYKVARPALWVLRLNEYTDRTMRLAGYVNRTALAGTQAAQKVNAIIPLVLKKDKTANDQRTLNENMAYLKRTMPALSNNLLILSAETGNPRIKELREIARFFDAAVAAGDTMGGNKKEGRFLILFLNDKELRPGGGFIGSYGILTFGHYSLKNIKIHDVYDADGQLKEHFDPPPAVSKYLQNPHWFLRDSNFSPDFKENAERAEFFLDRELGAQDFDGVIGITTTTIENMIGAYGEIALPTGDVITKENFYEKTQQQVHENFFPGSRQKQNTLSALADGLMSEFGRASKEELGRITREMILNKQIVVYMKNNKLQSILEEYNWGGRMLRTGGDYLYPVEANVGVNKVNKDTSTDVHYEVRITTAKPAKHIYTSIFTNSYSGPLPGENIYKNYFQLYVPKHAKIEAVLLDGRPAEYEVWSGPVYTAPAVYMEVLPQSSKKLTVIYTMPLAEQTGIDREYDLTVQKQTGSKNGTFRFSVTLPRGSSVISKDFDAEVRGLTLTHRDVLNKDLHFRMKFTAQ